MFEKILIANRGEIALRVQRACRELGIKTLAVYSEADAGAPYLEMASETYAIGPAPARESYLNQDVLIEVLRQSRADGLHPGYVVEADRHGVRIPTLRSFVRDGAYAHMWALQQQEEEVERLEAASN